MTADASLLFAARRAPSLPILGRGERFPVGRIFCVGRNYAAHAREMGGDPTREEPFYFTKSVAALGASGTTIPYPPMTRNFHHEMELVVAIDQPGFNVAVSHARSLVFGYACGLDMTRRDLQLAARDTGRPWDLGKDIEYGAIVGAIRPASDGGHPDAGRLELRVNGAVRQAADLSQLIWSVPEVLSHLSRYYRLAPGDLVFTGTPEGVGPVVAGDRLEGSIERVGTVEATIGPAAP